MILILVILLSLFAYYKVIFDRDERPDNYESNLTRTIDNIENLILYQLAMENDYGRVINDDEMVIFTETRDGNSEGSKQKDAIAHYYKVDVKRLRIVTFTDLDLRGVDDDGSVYLEAYRDVLKKLEDIFEELDPLEDGGLPFIRLNAQGDLHIKSSGAEKTFYIGDLLAEFIEDKGEGITYRVKAMNEKAFRLDFYLLDESGEERDYILAFFTRDLEDVSVMDLSEDGIVQAVEAGTFDTYDDLFYFEKESYLGIDIDSKKIIDKAAKKLVEVQESDFLDQDGYFVYKNGRNPIDMDEVQQIQGTNEYLANEGNSLLEFELDLEEIKRQIGMDKKAEDAYVAELAYMDSNLAIMDVKFANGMKTNLIIDFVHHRNRIPFIYVVNLYME